MTQEELTQLAIVGLKQLKAETSTNAEIYAVLALINVLLNFEAVNE